MNRFLMTAVAAAAVAGAVRGETDYYAPSPFGTATRYAKDADNTAIGEWWNARDEGKFKSDISWFKKRKPADALAFAVYTQDRGVLKLTAQCFPLRPEEPKSVTLELERDGTWREAALIEVT